MILNQIHRPNSDQVGAWASSICLVHCFATPFLFVAQSCSATCCDSSPIWWQSIDYIFIAVSFFAVYWSVRNSTVKWLKNALWVCWILLSVVILNEKLALVEIPEWTLYLPALALVVLHLYNRKYCQCKNDACCATV